MKVVDWLKINKLFLNLKKPHFIILRKSRQKLNLENVLFIDNIKIAMKPHTQLFGVLVDQPLTFEEHCEFIKEKLHEALGYCIKAKNILIKNRYWLLCTMHSYTHILRFALLCGVILFRIFLTRLWNYRKGLYALLMGREKLSYRANL